MSGFVFSESGNVFSDASQELLNHLFSQCSPCLRGEILLQLEPQTGTCDQKHGIRYPIFHREE